MLKLISGNSLTFHGLSDCTLWVQWCHSLRIDPSAAFYENHLPFTLALTTRIIRALPLRHIIATFLSQRRRPVCKRWACLVLTTHYTVHVLSSDYAKDVYRIYHPSNFNIRTRASVYYHKNFEKASPKKWNSKYFFGEEMFQRKKSKKKNNFSGQPTWKEARKRSKVQMKFYRLSNLEQGQVSEIEPKISHLGNPA